jgi:ABC-type multidrug transport system fused ATPase/permease subunit
MCRSNDQYDLSDNEDEHGVNVKGSQVYVWVYCGLTVAFFFIQVMRTGLIFYGTTCAANRLYKKMLHRVLNTPMGFFLVKPVGELLNTFSSDQNKADEALPDAAHLACMPLHTPSNCGFLLHACKPTALAGTDTRLRYFNCFFTCRRDSSFS